MKLKSDMVTDLRLGLVTDQAGAPGVVLNFGPFMGTGAGRRAQDMTELEIFGNDAAKSDDMHPDPAPSKCYWGKSWGKAKGGISLYLWKHSSFQIELVEPRGIEPLASSLRTMRSTN